VISLCMLLSSKFSTLHTYIYKQQNNWFFFKKCPSIIKNTNTVNKPFVNKLDLGSVKSYPDKIHNNFCWQHHTNLSMLDKCRQHHCQGPEARLGY
jgi:hypothetical protein